MAESQPGQVQAFDPTVTLSNFSAEDRDTLMYNENQLALAKLQQPRPTSASAVNRSGTNTFTSFDDYLNLSGEFVYIDGSFQSLSTPGVPTLPVHRISIGFDRQITTDTIKFWSVGFVQTSQIFVEWSFDNVTWFDAGAITWSQAFDDTIEVFPGDVPPTGEFVYTGTIDGGEITARYWRIRSDAEGTVSAFGSGNATIGSDAAFFPASGDVLLLDSGGVYQSTLSYTGKNSTQLTGVTGGTPGISDILVSVDYSFADQVTEVQIIPTLSPIIEHWNSDGSKAVTVTVEGSDYYHMAYDKFDDVYYAIRFETDLNLSDSLVPDDDFDDASFGSSFDSSKWIESTANPYFFHNTASGTLDMNTSAGAGQLSGNYGVDGNYILDIELVAALELNADGFFGLESKDYDSGNQYSVSALKGPYTPGTDTSGTFVGATLEYASTLGASAELQDFRIKPEAFDFGFPGGEVVYELTYSAGSDEYTVTASGITHPSATPGVPYTLMDSATFTVSNLSTPANGQKFTITTRIAEASIAGTSVSGVGLQLERSGTNSYVRYEDTDAPGFITLHTGNIPSTARVRPQLFGDPNSAAVDIGADNYTVTGGTIFFDTPVFSLVTINKQGFETQVAGVSDVDGFAIKSFDVIRNPQASYNSFLSPRVAVATNGLQAGSGGEIYIKVNDTLYKYDKADFPLVNETGSTADLTTTGEIPETGITNFAYNGYSSGGLSYVEYESDLGGVFVKSISTLTMAAVQEKAFLDVASISFPFAWNVSDLATLYFVDAGSALKLYDLNETKAAFVNVTSDKQVLAAGTSETATITGQVLNVYGDPKSNKSMTFSVSAGDGAISPAVGCSDGSGEDTTTYTVGSSVGTATITVTVSDTAC